MCEVMSCVLLAGSWRFLDSPRLPGCQGNQPCGSRYRVLAPPQPFTQAPGFVERTESIINGHKSPKVWGSNSFCVAEDEEEGGRLHVEGLRALYSAMTAWPVLVLWLFTCSLKRAV